MSTRASIRALVAEFGGHVKSPQQVDALTDDLLAVTVRAAVDAVAAVRPLGPRDVLNVAAEINTDDPRPSALPSATDDAVNRWAGGPPTE